MPESRYDLMSGHLVATSHGAPATGNRALYELGMTGIPIVNVNNNCASGVSGLYYGTRAVEYGRPTA